ncbi:hypothetical protein [Streptomyces noursei]|uniref:hypothetical protein n=1 Tax=Streptomyces noursei TaxID=1971 RepID=UPI0023B868E4|nr:hypothetical protein [Streptomyces noursei]
MTVAEIALIVAVWGVIAWAVAVRLGPLVRRHQPTEPPAYAAFTQPPAGARWLRCDTTACGHMTTLHTPQPSGAYGCTGCGHTAGAGA